MAATYTVVARGDLGAMYAEIGNLAFDSSYVANGYAVPSSIGLKTILTMEATGINTAGVGYSVQYNQQTGKVQVLWTGAATAAVLSEITAGTNLATVTATVMSYGY